MIDPTRETRLLSLSGASEELNRKGITERSRIFADTSPAFWVAAGSPGTAARGRSFTAVRSLIGAALLLALLALAVRVRAPTRRAPLLMTTGLMAIAALVLVLDRPPAGIAREPAGKSAPASPVAVPTGAPVRQYPIGLDVARNHLRITALWHRAVKIGTAPAPAPGVIHLLARIQATEGNPNGFARGDWVPSLSIHFTVTPVRGGPAVTGLLRPLVASDGPRYGANLSLPGPAAYRLKLRIEPPSDDALGRLVDPSDGVAPWWEPFEAEFAWTFRPESH